MKRRWYALLSVFALLASTAVAPGRASAAVAEDIAVQLARVPGLTVVRSARRPRRTGSSCSGSPSRPTTGTRRPGPSSRG